MLFEFLNKTLTSQGSLLPESNPERAAPFDGFLFLFIQLQWVGASHESTFFIKYFKTPRVW
jgi:hypothetical protein